MLEITADHIAELADDDLRELVGLLCEAELAKRGLPISAVTSGGDQRAGDGGLDVRVALPEEAEAGDFVPRPNTGFRVKRQDMPRAAILKEMCPAGQVRTVIRELADSSGAYVIACSQGSTSDSRLRNRHAAMKDAVGTLPNAANLAVEFYDRTRLASWVRQHVGLVPWVRTKIGKALRGWQAYGAWAYEPEGTNAEFLIDDTPRIQTRRSNDGAGLPVAAGIERMRAILREPRSIVRVVGLSGVGKTRLVQALFDARVGAESLDKALALYTNMSDDPDPQPVGMVSDLLASRSRAVVVVDNCGSELHRRLSEVCRVQGSTLSVITVEYDIQDDEPEGTEVFELLSSSEGLVEQLIRRRFPHVSTVDAHTVAEFSGGNAPLLGEVLRELSRLELDFSLELTGFEVGEIDLLIADIDGEPPAEDPADAAIEKVSTPAVSKLGDLWLLGDHRVFCGSAVDPAALQVLMCEDRAAMVFTDPPYNVPIDGHATGLGNIHHRSFAMAAGEMSLPSFAMFLERSLKNQAASCLKGSLLYVCMDWRHMNELLAAGRDIDAELLNLCVWVKDNGGMGSLYRSQHELVFVFKTGDGPHRNNVQLGRFGRNRSNVWRYPGVNSFSRKTEEGNLLALHPTVKPVALVGDAILDCTARGDIVLDGFLGSGTTLIAAERERRRCFGTELDPGYVDTIIRRWQKLSGNAARHAGNGRTFTDLAAEVVEVANAA